MKLEPTTFDQLKPGDLFVYAPDERMDFASVQVRLEGDEPGNVGNVVRIVCECQAQKAEIEAAMRAEAT